MEVADELGGLRVEEGSKVLSVLLQDQPILVGIRSKHVLACEHAVFDAYLLSAAGDSADGLLTDAVLPQRGGIAQHDIRGVGRAPAVINEEILSSGIDGEFNLAVDQLEGTLKGGMVFPGLGVVPAIEAAVAGRVVGVDADDHVTGAVLLSPGEAVDWRG